MAVLWRLYYSNFHEKRNPQLKIKLHADILLLNVFFS